PRGHSVGFFPAGRKESAKTSGFFAIFFGAAIERLQVRFHLFIFRSQVRQFLFVKVFEPALGGEKLIFFGGDKPARGDARHPPPEFVSQNEQNDRGHSADDVKERLNEM